jgi:hypothetical protein
VSRLPKSRVRLSSLQAGGRGTLQQKLAEACGSRTQASKF